MRAHGQLGRLRAVRARRRAGRALQVRDPDARARAPASRPTRYAHAMEHAPGTRVARRPCRRLRLGRRRLDGRAPRPRSARASRWRSTRSTSAPGRASPRKATARSRYREIAPRLVAHVQRLGFTHVELLPIAEHPFDGSWGYQVTGYYAPTVALRHARRLPLLRRHLPPGRHRRHPRLGAGALSRRTTTRSAASTAPRSTSTRIRRRGEHPDWGTLIFNYGRNEVRNFLLANAPLLARGLPRRRPARRRRRLDALPRLQPQGGRVGAEPLRRAREPRGDRRSCARSTRRCAPSCPGLLHGRRGVDRVARRHHARSREGGLGFTFKWNMGWMHDTLEYFSARPRPPHATTTTSSRSR